MTLSWDTEEQVNILERQSSRPVKTNEPPLRANAIFCGTETDDPNPTDLCAETGIPLDRSELNVSIGRNGIPCIQL